MTRVSWSRMYTLPATSWSVSIKSPTKVTWHGEVDLVDVRSHENNAMGRIEMKDACVCLSFDSHLCCSSSLGLWDRKSQRQQQSYLVIIFFDLMPQRFPQRLQELWILVLPQIWRTFLVFSVTARLSPSKSNCSLPTILGPWELIQAVLQDVSDGLEWLQSLPDADCWAEERTAIYPQLWHNTTSLCIVALQCAMPRQTFLLDWESTVLRLLLASRILICFCRRLFSNF